jgi:LuxR family maltose regulon positive regulatory protein
MSDGSGQCLLRSKVAIPALHSEHLSRHRLLAALEGAPSRPLTLVSAPAGSGKTQLLIEWRRRTSPAQRTAWLTLDDYDNDPVTL